MMDGHLQSMTRKLLWSLWSEIGVPGGGRWHRKVVIEPEPLIAVTPHLANGDNRLLQLSFDWCIAHAEQISKSRLRGIWKLLPNPARERLQDFNAALARGGVHWKPQSDTPLEFDQDRKRMALPLERPALLTFRIRAVAGVSVRADVLMRLLFVPPGGTDVASLVPWGSYRRGVERVLNELADAGQVLVTGTERRRLFRLRNQDGFSELMQAKDLRWWNWGLVFWFFLRLRELVDATTDLSEKAARVRILSQQPILERWAASIGAQPPPRVEGRPQGVEILAEWFLNLSEMIAEGEAPEQVPMMWPE